MLEPRIQQHFFESADLSYQAAETMARPLAAAAQALVDCLTAGGRVWIHGRGIAQAPAQLLGAALSGRFERERPGLAAMVLGLDALLLSAAQPAGTDAPAVPGMVPGISLHEDLSALRDAGLSPYEVLATATRNAGRFIHETVPGAASFGQVAPGFRADLVLTEDDPLAVLATLREPLGVMSQGVWYDRPALARLLDGIAQDYRDAFAADAQARR